MYEQSNDDTYVVSLSSRTIVYKGMFLVEQLRLVFADLQDKDYESAIATVHSRFSTNTNPSWERAHLNLFFVDNCEINTIRGNADKMLASLSVQYTRVRQASITQEITEVSSGAKAQKRKKVQSC